MSYVFSLLAFLLALPFLTSPSSFCWFLTSSSPLTPPLILLVILTVLRAITVPGGWFHLLSHTRTVRKYHPPGTSNPTCPGPNSFSSSPSPNSSSYWHSYFLVESPFSLLTIESPDSANPSWHSLKFVPIFCNQETIIKGTTTDIYWVLSVCQTLFYTLHVCYLM